MRRRQLETMLALLVPPLLSLTHGDGSLGSWQGAWAIDAGTVATLIDASGVRTRPLRDVRQWGYQRIAAQKSILQFDAAPPPLLAPCPLWLRVNAGFRTQPRRRAHRGQLRRRGLCGRAGSGAP